MAAHATEDSTARYQGSSETEFFEHDAAREPRAEEHAEDTVASPQADRMPHPLRPARSVTPIPVPPAVIPLVHAPDDPGTEPEAHTEPGTNSSIESADNWSRIRQLFRPQP